jgi:hypothetical protein
MKPTNLCDIKQYEVKLLDGTRYKGEIAYRDDKMVVLVLTDKRPQRQLRLFQNGIISIQELGWQRNY